MLKERYAPEQWVTGSDPVENTLGVVASNASVDKYAPLGQITATGEFTLWDPEANDGRERAVRLAAFAFATGATAVPINLIKSGTFNPELVAWPADVTTAQQNTAFVGTPISLQSPR